MFDIAEPVPITILAFLLVITGFVLSWYGMKKKRGGLSGLAFIISMIGLGMMIGFTYHEPRKHTKKEHVSVETCFVS